MPKTYQDILNEASEVIESLRGETLDIVDVKKPLDIDYAYNLSKVVSKLSPFLGNMIEFATVAILNDHDWEEEGKWIRQDPGFPDTLFVSENLPPTGIEIKTWFPLATEITARFKDSITHFQEDHTNVALIAWLPEYILYGKPVIIDVWVGTAKSVAEARDTHYHRPPNYVVIEPEDTTLRARNLQQTNTSGYVFQGTDEEYEEAMAIVEGWGVNGRHYLPDRAYQQLVLTLLNNFRYRLDTNYAKMDRIEHAEIEAFKQRVLNTRFHGRTIKKWAKLINSNDQEALEDLIRDLM